MRCPYSKGNGQCVHKCSFTGHRGGTSECGFSMKDCPYLKDCESEAVNITFLEKSYGEWPKSLREGMPQ